MIKARVSAENPEANLGDYQEKYRSFKWEDVAECFTWHTTGRINMAHEAVDRWAMDPDKKDRTALIFEKGGTVERYTYLQLQDRSAQWANLLDRYGFETGDRLFVFLPPCPQIYFALLACARIGALFCPIYATSTFDEVSVRIADAAPKGILTHPDLAEMLPADTQETAEFVFLSEGPLPNLFPSEILIDGIPQQMPTEFSNAWLPPRSPLYLSYTSGSTGPPKGVVHTHDDMKGIFITATYVLDLREDTILWVDADPAWVTGIVYGVLAPWLCGATALVQGDPFEPANWYWTLEKHQVSVWYTTPRTLNRLKEAGGNLASRYDISHLRHMASVGALLVPDLFYWAKQHLGRSPHDTYWMTETGMICIANFPSMDIKPGSIGRPVPGVTAAILDEGGEPMPPLSLGELALKPGWPAEMSGLWGDEARYQAYYNEKGWFMTGDIAIMDDEGYYFHQGRNDDLIKAGGHKVIGPYEIEQVLCMHPAVSEAAVISKGAEPEQGISYLKAFITVHKGFTPSARLNHEIKAFVKASLSSDIIVKELTFLERLPKTRSGKLLRRVLRAGELGLPAGDTANMAD
ncbi:MAG: AMP-binding protein [Desulfobacteraceae bacterium]